MRKNWVFLLGAVFISGSMLACSSTSSSDRLGTKSQAIEFTEWSEGSSYSVGDIVLFEGQTYRATQVHTAYVGAGWTPPAVASLWEVYEVEQEVPTTSSLGTLSALPTLKEVLIENDCRNSPENCCPSGSTAALLSSGPDTLQILTPGACVLAGHGSDTLFLQSEGASALHAGPGHDTIMDGPGDDLIMGGDGNDTINAWSGPNSGTNLLFGGAGDDTIMAANGTNVVIPGPGRDTVALGTGDDTLYIFDDCEVSGGETISGGPGHDKLILPRPLSEMQALGLNVSGFEEVIVEPHSCYSECTEKPDCSGRGYCVEAPIAGEMTCSEQPEVECSTGLKTSVVDVRGEARALWLGDEDQYTGRSLSPTLEIEVEFDSPVFGDHPHAWFQANGCERNVLATALSPASVADTVTFTPVEALVPGCSYDFIIARYRGLNPQGLCLDERLEIGLRIASAGDEHDFALAQHVNFDGPLSYFQLREGIHLSPEDAFKIYEDVIGIPNLDLRKERKITLEGSDKTNWRYVQHVKGYPVRGAQYSVATIEEGGKEWIFSAFGFLAEDVDIADNATIAEASALSTALNAMGSSSADWVTRPTGKLMVWTSPLHENATGPRYALSWHFAFYRTDHQDPSEIPAAVGAWVDATTGQTLEMEWAAQHASYLQGEAAQVELTPGRWFDFTAAKWENDLGLTETRVNGEGGEPTLNRIQTFAPRPSPSDPFPIVSAIDPNNDLLFSMSEGSANHSALLMQTAQATRTFIDGLNLLDDWKGLTGQGDSIALIDFYPRGVAPPQINGKDIGVHFKGLLGVEEGDEVSFEYGWVNTATAPSLNTTFDIVPTVVAHEFGHAVSINSRLIKGELYVAKAGAPDSISEGLADVYGIAYAQSVLGAVDWSVVKIHNNDLSSGYHGSDRIIGNPAVNGNPAFVGQDTGGPAGPEYQTTGESGHHNSTIVSRWAYLLGTGDNSIPGKCNYPARQLAPADIAGSMKMVLRIAADAYRAISSTATFVEFRQKTEEAAVRLYGPDVAQKVSTAWLSVGVGGSAHAALTEFRPQLSGVDPWTTFFSLEHHGLEWEIRFAKTEADLITAPVHAMKPTTTGNAVFLIDLEPGETYYWQAKVKHPTGSSWNDCALINESFETDPMLVDLRSNMDSSQWKGAPNEVYKTGHRGRVSWTELPHANFNLFLTNASQESACEGTPDLVTNNNRTIALEPWDDFWGDSSDKGNLVSFHETIWPEVDTLPDEIYTLAIQPQSKTSSVKGKCYEFQVRKGIIEEFAQYRPSLSNRPKLSFDPHNYTREHVSTILPPADFLFVPANTRKPPHVRPGPAVPDVEAYELVVWKFLIQGNRGPEEVAYRRQRKVSDYPDLKNGTWKFDEASDDWLPNGAFDGRIASRWEIFAIVDGNRRQAAIADNVTDANSPPNYNYDDVQSPKNWFYWEMNDLPPGHFMWVDKEATELIAFSSSWAEVVDTRTETQRGGFDAVVYEMELTLELDSYWTEHGIPVYPGVPSGPMDGYVLRVFGIDGKESMIEVTRDNWQDVGFGGPFNKASDPKFLVSASKEARKEKKFTRELAGWVTASAFDMSDGVRYGIGDNTYLDIYVSWIDTKNDSTVCGEEFQDCCDGASCLPGLNCEGGACLGQGEPGESCENQTCDSGASCNDGQCLAIPRCNDTVDEGDNYPRSVVVDMGSSSGTGTFRAQTFYARDQMILRDQSGNKIMETQCVGTQAAVEALQNCSGSTFDGGEVCYISLTEYAICRGSECEFADGWFCNRLTGECDKEFSYSGGGLLTVEVQPNCGGTDNTEWNFTVACY